MINLIIKYTQIFILDQYGNYVVQYVIMLKDMNVNKQIADEFLKMNVISISKQKFSSNVIEKVKKKYNTVF
jgi:pumilio RNA-binding family